MGRAGFEPAKDEIRQIYSLVPLATQQSPPKKPRISPPKTGQNQPWKVADGYGLPARAGCQSQRRDSNPRPAVYKTAALPTELRWPDPLENGPIYEFLPDSQYELTRHPSFWFAIAVDSTGTRSLELAPLLLADAECIAQQTSDRACWRSRCRRFGRPRRRSIAHVAGSLLPPAELPRQSIPRRSDEPDSNSPTVHHPSATNKPEARPTHAPRRFGTSFYDLDQTSR